MSRTYVNWYNHICQENFRLTIYEFIWEIHSSITNIRVSSSDSPCMVQHWICFVRNTQFEFKFKFNGTQTQTCTQRVVYDPTLIHEYSQVPRSLLVDDNEWSWKIFVCIYEWCILLEIFIVCVISTVAKFLIQWMMSLNTQTHMYAQACTPEQRYYMHQPCSKFSHV